MKKEKSCGLIVIRDDNKVLLIQQKSGFFGFPKGHMEDGESEIETAIRETKEETNLDVIIDETKRFSLSYVQNKIINKEVVYFIAKPINSFDLVAQKDEIQRVVWIDLDKVEKTLQFSNIKELWKEVLQEIQNK